MTFGKTGVNLKMNILYINACVRNNSRTHELAQYALQKLHGRIQEVNLNNAQIGPLYQKQLLLRDELIKKQDYSHEIFKYAKQFAQADTILIAAPYWDLSFPSILKIYFENINVSGITFYYSEKGCPVSLCKAKKLIYITTAGGPILSDDYGFGYIQSLATNFYAIKEVRYIKAEGLDIWGASVQEILAQTKQQIDKI